MSESEFPNPIPPSQDGVSNPGGLSDDAIQPDPLLGSGSFIDPDGNYSMPEVPECENHEVKQDVEFEDPDGNYSKPEVPECDNHETKQDVEFEADSVIDAQPISMLAPGDNWAESTPKTAKIRSLEEMEKRPSWLPDDWRMELKVRGSGATAGTIDRYYVAPEGQRKLRSKNEVVKFLESGGKAEGKSKSDAVTEPSSGSRKQTKSSGKRKKSETAEA